MRIVRRSFPSIASLIACLLPLVCAATDRQCATPHVVDDEKYKPGQVWTYQSRRGEADSTITILRVESSQKVGIILHIRIDGVRFANCHGGPSPDTIEHAPFKREAIEQSTVRLVQSQPVPDFHRGYDDWISNRGEDTRFARSDLSSWYWLRKAAVKLYISDSVSHRLPRAMDVAYIAELDWLCRFSL